MTPPVGRSVRPATGRFAYRPGLDGLRALAVLCVITFHFGADWLPGGYLGVDVFLVLSGFLIATLLLREHAANGRVDVASFWARRSRRLLPALVLLLLVLSVWAALWATPREAAALRTDAVASLLYVANWWFVAGSADYLAAAEPSLLLHTWSLGLEEQWYLILPLLLIVVLRGRSRSAGHLLLTFAVLAVGSAAVMLWLAASGADHARIYYGTDTRLFALLLGAIAATLVHRHGWPRPAVADLAGAAGLVVLVVAATSLGALHPFTFRGGLVVVALAATALVLAVATPGTRLGGLLGWRPLVAVGVVSYGLYLWHWPVHRLLLDQPLWWRLTVAGVVAAASYIVVERPMRSARFASLPRSLRPAVPLAAMAVAGVVIVGATSSGGEAAASGSDLDTAVTGQVLRVAPPEDDPETGDESAPRGAGSPATPRAGAPRASARLPDRTLDVLVLGDSVAFSLAYHRPESSLRLRVSGEHVLGCGITEQPLAFPGGGVLNRPHCRGYVDRWPDLVTRADPDVTLVVIGAWEVHDHLSRGDRVEMGSEEHDRLVTEALRRGLDAVAAGGRPVVVTDVPCFGTSEPGDPRSEPLRLFHLNALLAQVVSEYPDASMAALSDRLCPRGDDEGGEDVRYDGVHFTPRGAAEVWPWLDQHLRAAVADQRRS